MDTAKDRCLLIVDDEPHIIKSIVLFKASCTGCGHYHGGRHLYNHVDVHYRGIYSSFLISQTILILKRRIVMRYLAVKYKNNMEDIVSAPLLDQMIESGSIKQFYRPSSSCS
jgi:hypothetical protein